MKKIEQIRKTWYDWLFNYISVPIKKLQMDLKIKLKVFLTQTYLNKPCMGEERQ